MLFIGDIQRSLPHKVYFSSTRSAQTNLSAILSRKFSRVKIPHPLWAACFSVVSPVCHKQMFLSDLCLPFQQLAANRSFLSLLFVRLDKSSFFNLSSRSSSKHITATSCFSASLRYQWPPNQALFSLYSFIRAKQKTVRTLFGLLPCYP